MPKTLEEKGIKALKTNKQFFKLYHGLHEPSSSKYLTGVVQSPRHEYLKAVDESRLAPRRLKTGQRNTTNLDLHEFSMGDQYAQALSTSLQMTKSIETISLQANRLTDKSLQAITDFLCQNRHVHAVDMSNNSFTSKGMKLFRPVLADACSTITELHLGHNTLRDRGVQQLCTALEQNSSLKLLDLAKIHMKDAGAVALGKWLQNPQCHLRELNVAWNEFRAPGGLAVLQGALANTNLRKLDLSWNGIGSGSKNTEALDMLQQVIRHSMLLHLSLTHNSFTKDALDQIGHAILQSEYLVAVHVEQPNEVGHPSFVYASTPD